MPANTIYADINEIWFGYKINNSKWFDKEAEKAFNQRIKEADPSLASLQKGRAEAMATECIKWAKAHGYKTPIKQVFWTARPGSMTKAVGYPVDQKKNPADILIRFTSGPSQGFLGVSAKSTHSSGDIGFKNPGMGTIETSLKLDLSTTVNKITKQAITQFKLPDATSERKTFIRANPAIQTKTTMVGSEILTKIRDIFFTKLKTLNQTKLREYLLTYWLDSSNSINPPYIKITGRGNKPPFQAAIDNPLKNDKLSAIQTSHLMIEKNGDNAIGVKAGSKRILKMRTKYESEKLASGIKMSGDPWK